MTAEKKEPYLQNRQPERRNTPLFVSRPENPLILAPMAGVTDRPFRTLAKRYGAGIVCMEMVSANAIKYGNKKTEELIRIDPEEHPVSLQLFGPDPDTMALAAEYVSGKYEFDILDINMGCPMPKIVNNHEGCALMRDPELAGRIVEAVRNATDLPVTVKMRAGFSEDEINAPELAVICEQAGAAAIAVHGRTREQYYTGNADWSVIRDVVSRVKIPVIGNGDADSPERVRAMLRETGCSYVMIGRASRGNPWLFAKCAMYLRGEDPDRMTVSKELLCETLLEHARMQVQEKGETMGMLEMRKHAAWYMAGQRNAAFVRRSVNTITRYEELERLLDTWLGDSES